VINQDAANKKTGENEKQIDPGPGKERRGVQPTQPGVAPKRQHTGYQMVPQDQRDRDSPQAVELNGSWGSPTRERRRHLREKRQTR
jgi:hypothetical protein